MQKFILLVVLLAVGMSTDLSAQKSPRKQATGSASGANIEIDYSAPSVKDRKIWGGLEAYDKVWRAGADKNTTVSFDKDVKLAGKDIKAGKYGFFIIPKESGDWVVIFNKKNDAWGAYSYNQSEDALRLDVSPVWADDSQEQLSYAVDGDNIVFAWEKVKLMIPVQ